MMRNPCHPGPVIRDLWLDGGSEAAAAERLGIDPTEFARLLNGDCPLSPEIALKLEAGGWSNAPFWMRLQAYYDLAQARLRLERRNRRPIHGAQPDSVTSPSSSSLRRTGERFPDLPAITEVETPPPAGRGERHVPEENS